MILGRSRIPKNMARCLEHGTRPICLKITDVDEIGTFLHQVGVHSILMSEYTMPVISYVCNQVKYIWLYILENEGCLVQIRLSARTILGSPSVWITRIHMNHATFVSSFALHSSVTQVNTISTTAQLLTPKRSSLSLIPDKKILCVLERQFISVDLAPYVLPIQYAFYSVSSLSSQTRFPMNCLFFRRQDFERDGV